MKFINYTREINGYTFAFYGNLLSITMEEALLLKKFTCDNILSSTTGVCKINNTKIFEIKDNILVITIINGTSFDSKIYVDLNEQNLKTLKKFSLE